MRRLTGTMAAAMLCAVAVAVSAQTTTQIHPGRGGSPHVRTEWTIDGAAIAITYGRPSLKGRTDAAVMPGGMPWRTGADEATTLTTDKALTFGDLRLPAGTYTINTQPGNEWQLIIGRSESPSQWGIPYQPDLEIGRAPMTVTRTAPVEVLTIGIDDTVAGGLLSIEWGTTRATIPFTVE